MAPLENTKRQRALQGIARSVGDIAVNDVLHCPWAQAEDEDERYRLVQIFFTGLLTGAQHPTAHFDMLDKALSTLLPLPNKVSDPNHPKSSQPIQNTVQRAEQLLSRLPDVPQRRFSLPFSNGYVQKDGATIWDSIGNGRWASKYATPELRSILRLQSTDNEDALMNLLANLQNLAWQNLYVTTLPDSNSLLLAVLFALQGTEPSLNLIQKSFEYVNLLSELVDEYQAICDAVSFGLEDAFNDSSEAGQALKTVLFSSAGDDPDQTRAIVKVFLWCAWQRSIMLHFYYIVGVQLYHGYSSVWNSFLAVRGVHELMFVSKEEYRGNSTEYLCNWAFEILRTNRTSLGLDFRCMISRFDGQFHDRKGRCTLDSENACEGGQPDSCQRFTGAETAAQSAHVSPCTSNCERIVWNSSSYMDCSKPAAILADKSSTTLVYVPVGSRTLAISHVWSHGQGGRPESGINSCLHQRYCRLAHQFDCESYWIDAAGIPSETKLRRPAIMDINKIFATAKTTIVIDADIQSIVVSVPSPTIEQIETLISTLLVCDWSVRGWTTLEAIRGSRALFLLCKDDLVVRLRESLITLHKFGAVDIAALLGCAQHLIPHADPSTTKTVEEASYILSQRHTSWPEDIIICWTLLMNVPVQRQAVELWKTQTVVRTGYLVSSSPRIQRENGYGWAPSTPYVRPIARSVDLGEGRRQDYTVQFPSYDGDGSLHASITPQGLQGKWRACSMDLSRLKEYEELCCEKMPDPEAYQAEVLDLANAKMLFSHPDDALAWFTVDGFLNSGLEVRLLRPLAADGVSPYTGTSERGGSFGLVAVVCTSADGGMSWEWKGVFSWQESEDYVGWEVKEMLIV